MREEPRKSNQGVFCFLMGNINFHTGNQNIFGIAMDKYNVQVGVYATDLTKEVTVCAVQFNTWCSILYET